MHIYNEKRYPNKVLSTNLEEGPFLLGRKHLVRIRMFIKLVPDSSLALSTQVPLCVPAALIVQRSCAGTRLSFGYVHRVQLSSFFSEFLVIACVTTCHVLPEHNSRTILLDSVLYLEGLEE